MLLGRGGVTGIVTDATDAVVPGARVLVTSDVDPSSFALTETDGEGRYIATNLVVGAVTVKAVLDTSSGIAAGNLQRAGTFTNVNVTINLTAGRVSGGVFEADGQDVVTPIDGIEVFYLVPGPAGRELVAASGETDAFGLFTFQDVPAGDFRIVAVDRIRTRQTSKLGTLTVVGGEAIIENFDVLFFTEDVGTLTVSVQDSLGAAVEGAIVTAAGRQLLTDATGQTTLTNLAPGTYTVSARGASSSRSVATSADVIENQTTNVTLALPGMGRVVVTVLDVHGTPIQNQQVIRTLGGPCAGEAILTDAAGVALFEDIPVGNVTVKATNGLDIAAASTFIQRSGDERAVILQFAGFGTITGTVFDPNDAAVFGANVVLSAKRLVPNQCAFVNDGAAQQVQTGLDGTFTFRNVPLGSFGVSASQPDFFPLPVSVAGVLLTDGETRDVELRLTSNLAGELSGTVFLPDGTTPAGIGVDVTVSGGGRPDVTVRTDTLGVYSFASIFPAGRYTLTASDAVTGKLSRETIFLQQDQDLTVDLRLLGRAPVEVTVLDGTGVPVDEAFVELASASFPNDRAAGSITALDGGTIIFERISEGNFAVTASDSLGRGGRANGMVVEEGLTAEVTVSLSVTGTVRGTFFSSDGTEPIPNAQVILRQGSTGRLLGATTTSSAPGELGDYELSFIPAGSVLATATGPLTGRIGETSGTIANEGEVVVLDILQLGLGSLAGSVTSGGAPVAAGEVELTSTTGLSSSVANLRASATTNGNGGFMFDGVPVGSFTLKATLANLTGMVTGSIDQDGQEIGDLEIALEPSGTVTGEVFRADASTIVPGAPVALKPARGILRTEADSVARYRVELVPVGDFTVTAEEPGGADAGIVNGTLSEGEELTVDVVFNGTGTVSGTAFESDGLTPLASGKVRLTRFAPFARDETVNIASDGTFQFLRIPVGDYSLSLTAFSLRGTAMGNITADGDTDDVTIKLADSGNVFGVLVKPDVTGGTVPAANVPVTASGSFFLSTLSDTNGAFRIEGIPLGDFTVRAEDPVTGGISDVPTTMATNGEELDLGTLELDIDPVSVAAIAPADGSSVVPPDATVVVTFTDPVEPASVPGRFFVRTGGTNIAGSTVVAPDGLSLTFTATPFFPPASTIDVLISKNLTDTLGRNLGADFTSSFATGGAVVTGTVLKGSVAAVGVDVTLTAGVSSTNAVTDAAGLYRFEDVPRGDVTVQAIDPSDGRGASASTVLGPTVGVATIDLSLAFVGSVTGQVREFDAAPSGAGLDVVISSSGTTLAATSTAVDGTYLVSNVPVGPVTIDVVNPANGDRGQTSGSVSNQQTTTADVTMIGVGSLRLFVRDDGGVIVTTAQTEISFTRLGSSQTIPNNVTEGDGSYLFPNVLAGAVNASVDDTVSGLMASGSGTVVAGQELVLNITLEPAGSIKVTVVAPDTTSPVTGAAVELHRLNSVFPLDETTSDAAGEALFENVTVSGSPYRIDVEVNGRLQARARDVAVTANNETALTLALTGLGSVSGDVLPPFGQMLSTSNVRVDLTSLAAEVGGILSDDNATDGTYLISEVPVGAFTLNARDIPNGFQGEAAGAVTSDGENVVIDIQLIENAITFSSFGNRLFDGNEARYRVLQNGALNSDSKTLFDSAGDVLNLDISVDGGAATAFVGQTTGSEEESGRELVTSTEDIDGVRVQRKIFVAQDGYFARYLEVFENLGATAVNVTATLTSNLTSVSASNGDVELTATSSGDAAIDPADFWVVTDDAKDQDPFESASTGQLTTAFVFAGETGLAPRSIDFQPSGIDAVLTANFDVTVPALGRTVLMHFVSQESFRNSAEAAADRLRQLPPEALVGLGLDEIVAVANFNVPADGVSTVEALPPLDGNVFGRLLAHDGVTGVGFNTGAPALPVRFNSDHILYRRIRTVNPGSDGRFSLKSSLGSTTNVVIPRVGFTISSTRSVGALSATASVTTDFTDRALFTRAEGAVLTATSSFGPTTGPDEAADGNLLTDWRTATGVTTAGFDVTLPVGVSVDSIRIFPVARASLSQVQIDLLDEVGQVLDSRTETFVTPTGALTVSIEPPVSDVHQVSFLFSGDPIRVGEIEVAGTTATDLGHAAPDVVFTGTAGIRLEVTRSSGEGLKSRFTGVASNGGAIVAGGGTTGDDGVFTLLAPIPVGAAPVTFSITASNTVVGHQFLKTTAQEATLTADATTLVTAVFPETASITGHVTDSLGRPVSGQSVALFSSTGGGQGKNTDNSGNFAWNDLPPDTYTLRIVASGRLIFSPPIVLSPPTSAAHNFQIPVFGSIDLTVLFETAVGNPAEPADLTGTITDALGSRRLNTNASGQTTIVNVPGGASFTIEIPHPNDLANVTIETGTITSDGQLLPLTVTIPALGALTGTVRFSDTTAAPNAAVELSGAGVTPQTGTANASGVYAFTRVEGLRPLDVLARHPADDRNHIIATANGEVAGQGQTSNLDVTLPGTGAVELTVVESDGTTPVVGADVSIQDSFSGAFRAESASDTAGLVTITIVPEGGFTVRAEESGLLVGEATGTMPVGATGDVISVTITRQNAAAEGNVLAIDGLTPVPQAAVELLSADGATLIDSTAADVGGFYQFTDKLPPGTTLTLRALFPDDNTIQTDVQVTATQAGEIVETDITLDVTVIKGFAFDADGVTPLTSTCVFLTPFGTLDELETTTDDQGFFAFFNFEEGHKELFTEGPFGLTAIVSTELLPGETVLVQDLVLPEFGTVEGFVTDDTGSPLTGSDVILTNANVLTARTASPDATGFFRFERVALGAFALTYDHPSADLDPDTGANIIIPANAVGELTMAGSTVSADIALPATGAVFGEIRDGGVVVVADEGTLVTLEGRQHETSDGFYQRNQDFGNETYNQPGVPVGEITAVGQHLGDVGEVTGAVTEAGTTELNPELGTVVSLPHEPEPAATERHEVTSEGTLVGAVDSFGLEPEFSFSFLNGKSFPNLRVARLELGGEQVVLGPTRVAGIRHTRKFRVPGGAPYARALYIFENTNAVDMTLYLFLEGDVFIDTNFVTSSGGDILQPDDSYLIGANDDGTGIGVVFAGAGAVRRPDLNGDDLDFYSQEWRNLVVPAGERVILMAFFIQASNFATVQSRANDLMNLTDPSVTSDLTAAEKADIINFIVP